MKQFKKIILYLSSFICLLNCASISRNKLEKGCTKCSKIQHISSISWKYAQLSENVYNESFQFKLDKYFEKIEDFENKKIDFFATLYKEKLTGQFVFIFRGTDSIIDFYTGNIPFFINNIPFIKQDDQNEWGLKIFDIAKSKYKFKDCIVSGHSLGGAIATYISLNKESVIAFTFNCSPIYKNISNINNDRYSISEKGEVLQYIRIFRRKIPQQETTIECSRGTPIKQHAIRKLARCLTEIAGSVDNEAKESLLINKIVSR